jgi:carboxyl-terminal processing protease
MSRRQKNGQRNSIVLASLAAATALAAALWAGSGSPLAFAKERYQELQIFTKVLNLVQQYYVEEVDTKKLIYGGIKGMLQELDPHTNFLPPEIYKEFESETSGEFGGIGIEITVQNDILTVISPIEDTPAWQAGIQSGDKIVEINGESTKGLSLAEAAQHMRGKMGSKVRLGIFRDGFDKPREFAIPRGVVKIHSVKYTDLEDGYAYIRLTSFIETSGAEMEKALKRIASEHGKIKGLVLDLRRNPGGLLDQAIKVSDLFLESGAIVSTMGRNQKDREVVYAKKEGTYSGFPIIVIVNEYSASAAEILAGALQDNKRALVMGQTTFGKGSVQSVVKLGDGSGLKLTVARYYTPSGRSIQAEGIKPDIVIEDVDSEAFRKAIVRREVRREQDMQNHLLGDREQKARDEQDGEKDGEKDGERKKDQAPTSIRAPEEESVNYWWTKDAKKTKPLTPKEKLLTDDFQALQAYNYLRAWKVMGSYAAASGLGDADAKADANKADGKGKDGTKAGEKPGEKNGEKGNAADPAGGNASGTGASPGGATAGDKGAVEELDPAGKAAPAKAGAKPGSAAGARKRSAKKAASKKPRPTPVPAPAPEDGQ